MPEASSTKDRIRDRVAGAVSELANRDATEDTGEATSPLPIRAVPEEVEALWQDPATVKRILEGIPASGATLVRGEYQGAWGTTFTVGLELDAPVPGMATRVLAAKAVRRLKALAETGEIPNTERNPAYREDAGEESS
jgi:hypothetical protein